MWRRCATSWARRSSRRRPSRSPKLDLGGDRASRPRYHSHGPDRASTSTRPVRAKAAGAPRPCAPAAESLGSGARGVAQPGSASALGAEGRVFKSRRPDQKIPVSRLSGDRRERRYLGWAELGSDPGSRRRRLWLCSPEVVPKGGMNVASTSNNGRRARNSFFSGSPQPTRRP